MTDADRLAVLLDAYYGDEPPPTAEDLARAGVTPDELGQVLELVRLDQQVSRSVAVATAREVADLAGELLELHPDWGR